MRTLSSEMIEEGNKMWQKINYGEPLLKELKFDGKWGALNQPTASYKIQQEATWEAEREGDCG